MNTNDANRLLQGKRILLIIGGGIAAYKSLDLIRRLRERGSEVRVVMTHAAQEFITPLSAGGHPGGDGYLGFFDLRPQIYIRRIRLGPGPDPLFLAPPP